MRKLILFLLHCFIFITLSCSQRKPDISTGKEIKELKPFDDIMISFMQKYKIPGGALAITKNGHLIYARGFGYY